MTRKSIDPAKLTIQAHDLFHKQWMLLTCGDFDEGKFNTMTIGWGSVGTMWSRPFVLVAVRPSRYTYQFMEEFDDFTVSSFPKAYHNALNLLGTKSGRDSDKISEAGLTPIPSSVVHSPSFAEANLIIECKKIYWHDFEPDHFIDKSIFNAYPNEDFHRVYFGEIQAIFGIDEFSV